MRENDDLDLLLDSALKSYSESEASPSLEQRILTRIAAQSSVAARPRWMPWAFVVPLAGCILLFALFLSQRNRAPTRVAVAPSASTHAPSVAHTSAPVRSTITRASIHSSRLSRRADRRAPLPKLDVFPTPEPLTPQEQALVAYTSQASAAKIQALIKAQNDPEQPLNISALRILPLEPPDEGNK